MENTDNKPKAVVEKKFWVTDGSTRVQIGISPTTGTICVYQYQLEGEEPRLVGRLPFAKYVSQFQAIGRFIGPVLGFIAWEQKQNAGKPEKDENGKFVRPATKEGRTSVAQGDTVEVEPITLEEMLGL